MCHAPAVLRDYYTRNLRFRLGDEERRGLAEFLRRAEEAGLSPRGAAATLAVAAT